MKIKKFNEDVNILKMLMLDIHSKINTINETSYVIDFDEKYNVSIILNITKNEIKTISVYHAQSSIEYIIRNNFKKVHIEIYIEDEILNQNKIYSIIAHELSHYYQILSGDNIYFDSFNKMINIENFKNTVKRYRTDFLNYIYYNFQHELDARIDQTYEAYLYSNDTFDNILIDFYDNELYKMLLFLKSYDSTKMISKYNNNILLTLTNQFNVLYNIDKITIDKLDQYYKNWENVFKENSDDYIKKSIDALKQANSKHMRYEKNFSYCYDTRPLYENDEYNMEDEILKLVDIFKKLSGL